MDGCLWNPCGSIYHASRISRGSRMVVYMIPMGRYRESQSFNGECSVCLKTFEVGEAVRQLPTCKHLLHAPCIDMWLRSHSNCPSCRTTLPPAFY
ncbi:hypothetical protein KFK09_012744 [Dendrobium nobile]|uniref:RING-type domain-containing protein n=1 Tax=Dendrobium nobile TaxID=94219 RepID=A0A8T3BLQ0_DENNO|nr:hypothetical protein KFK09_012744 [Dendrobium nobile]